MEYTIPYLALSDSSVNNRLRSCRRKFELNKLYGHARNESEGSLAADAGSALHAGWQRYMELRDWDAGVAAMMFRFPIHLQKSPMQERSLESCYLTLMEMYNNPLHSRYKLATVDFKGKPRPAVEVPFKIILKNVSLSRNRHVPIFWNGFIDAILWDTVTERYVVVDIKTTRKDRHDYTDMFCRDPQTLSYAYVVEQATGQTAAQGLDVIYFVAYIDHLNPRCQQITLHKSAQQVSEWAFSLAMDVNAIRLMADVGFFPKDGKSCDTYNLCQYANVCDYTEPSAIRQYLDQLFGPPDYTKADVDPWFVVELEIQGL